MKRKNRKDTFAVVQLRKKFTGVASYIVLTGSSQQVNDYSVGKTDDGRR